MHLDDPTEPVVIGDRQGGVTEVGCPAHQLGGMRSTVEEAEIRVGVEFRVTVANGAILRGSTRDILIERMFARDACRTLPDLNDHRSCRMGPCTPTRFPIRPRYAAPGCAGWSRSS